MKRPLTLLALLAALSFSLLAQNQPPADPGYHRLGEGGAAPAVVVQRPTNGWNLQGIRIGKLNFTGFDSGTLPLGVQTAGYQKIISSYAPRIKEQLEAAHIQPTGDPRDSTLNVSVLTTCTQNAICGGAIEVRVISYEEQRQVVVWEGVTPYVGYPVDVMPKLVSAFVISYLRDNQQSRQPQVIEIPGGPLTEKR